MHCLHTKLAGMMFIILVLVITIPVTQPHLEKLLFCIYLTEDKDSSLTRNVDGLPILPWFSPPRSSGHSVICWCGDRRDNNPQAFVLRRPKAG